VCSFDQPTLAAVEVGKDQSHNRINDRDKSHSAKHVVHGVSPALYPCRARHTGTGRAGGGCPPPVDSCESTLGVDNMSTHGGHVTFEEILNQAISASGAVSDSDLSRKLGVSRQAVSNWRGGKKFPDTVTCATLAGLTGIPLAQVLGVVGEARAISREEKAVWRKLAATAMMLCLAVGITLPSSGQATPKPGFSEQHAVYIMRNQVSGSVVPSPAP